MSLTGPATASFLLRIAVGVPFFVYSIGKFVDPASWVGYIPPWMSPLLPVSVWMFLGVVGVVECALGVLLILGLWTRPAALLAAAYLFAIILTLGINELAFRDASMLVSALALASLGHASCHLGIDGRRDHS